MILNAGELVGYVSSGMLRVLSPTPHIWAHYMTPRVRSGDRVLIPKNIIAHTYLHVVRIIRMLTLNVTRGGD